jgi:NTP pyrophosphatase (non-canonical NTP hydrolase)
MNLNDYFDSAISTAIFPEDIGIIYCALALNGEAGEIAEKVKKVIRDKNGLYSEEDRKAIALEIGDLLWYCANLANQFGYDLEEIAKLNMDKLQSRKTRNVLSGSGDNR